MAKPDNRSDNVEHLQESIQNTMGNLREAKDFLKAHRDEMRSSDREAIENKNERRIQAIQGFREEIRDEAGHANQ